MHLASQLPVRLARARAAFRQVRGIHDTRRRAAAIARLPRKRWRGVQVYAIDCDGDFGRGPHRLWVPEYVLWSLIDLRHFLCPFHR